MKCQKLSVLFVVCCLLSLLLVVPAVLAQDGEEEQGDAPEWGYKGDEGPEYWGSLSPEFELCKTGMSQSPIDFTEENLMVGDLDDIVFNYAPTALNIVNDGHGIQVNYDEGSSIEVNGQSYQLLQFHFHHPSEHTAFGEPYPMEVHLVHKADDDSLAVIGVFLEIGEEDNELLAALWANMPEEAGEMTLEDEINIDEVLPESRDYATYSGSLTTPPCSEDVLWIMLGDTIELSEAQVEAFADIYEMNARPVQPLNERDIIYGGMMEEEGE